MPGLEPAMTSPEVPAGHFEDVLMTKDVNPLEPKVLEFKFYAPNIGPVMAVSVSGGSDREELIRFDQRLTECRTPAVDRRCAGR